MTVLSREQWKQLQARYDVDGDPLPTAEARLRAGYADLHFESDERVPTQSDVTVYVTERATRIDVGDLELYADAKLGVTLLRKRPPYPINVWEVLYDRKAEVTPRDALGGLVEAEPAAIPCNVDSYPVFGAGGHSCRGHVRLDLDRIGHANQTEFCITIGCAGYLSPYEARQYAARLLEVADHAEVRIGRGKNDG